MGLLVLLCFDSFKIFVGFRFSTIVDIVGNPFFTIETYANTPNTEAFNDY